MMISRRDEHGWIVTVTGRVPVTQIGSVISCAVTACWAPDTALVVDARLSRALSVTMAIGTREVCDAWIAALEDA